MSEETEATTSVFIPPTAQVFVGSIFNKFPYTHRGGHLSHVVAHFEVTTGEYIDVTLFSDDLEVKMAESVEINTDNAPSVILYDNPNGEGQYELGIYKTSIELKHGEIHIYGELDDSKPKGQQLGYMRLRPEAERVPV